MKNTIIQSAFIIITISLSACGQAESPQAENRQEMAEFYIAAFETLLAEDSGLNEGMEYLIIDFEELPAADGGPTGNAATEPQTAEESGEKPGPEVIAEVLVYFEDTYGVETREGDMQTIEQEGMMDEETMTIDGILLTIEDVRFTSKTEAIMEGTKFKGGLGAIGLRMELKERESTWSVEQTEMLWVS
ncbi:hypothetical protein [Planococcus lenghuensis]|uniref:Uncharacterized protein n=1 Tax=Planococcus lenghuensis TaxID=2213202 RepID=A0A1Q2KY58_9BACL|nr:hypothetical protein [Planococcus lenghuensis]AQQ53083.1 hypothetical protein B0X71_08235 [Planococcus lenghuensis]